MCVVKRSTQVVLRGEKVETHADLLATRTAQGSTSGDERPGLAANRPPRPQSSARIFAASERFARLSTHRLVGVRVPKSICGDSPGLR